MRIRSDGHPLMAITSREVITKMQAASLVHVEAHALNAAVEALRQRRTREESARESTTSPSSSEEEENDHCAVVSRPPKKYKATYYQRKEEIEALQQQIEALQQALTEAKTKRAPVHDHVDLMTAVKHNTLLYAGVMAATAAHARTMVSFPSVVPLNTFIHLPVDATERRDILRRMRDHMLAAGYRFMKERTASMDLGLEYQQKECVELPGGDLTMSGLNVEHFGGGYSLRKVYDTFLYFTSNQEITISEQLGILTIRENEDMEDATQGQNRFVSTIPGGLEIEMNLAVFAGYFEATETEPAYAQIVLNYVDVDDLYPNKPETRGRKELNCAITMTEVSTAEGKAIAMARWSHVRFRAPEATISREERKAVRKAITNLCGLMSKAMRERLRQTS